MTRPSGSSRARAFGIHGFGNIGRNVLIGPGLDMWDLGADKDFRVTERFGIQFALRAHW